MAKPVALYYTMMKYQPENRELLDRLFAVIERDDPRAASADDLRRAEVLFAPLGFEVDGARIDACPSLRAIVSNTTGVPHIDMDAAARRGIAVCALHDEQDFLDTITPTAEHAVALMLAASRRLPAAHRAAAQGQWDRRPWGAPRMFSRLRLGVVGFGRLGRKVARIGEAMGMAVDWFDPGKEGGATTLVDLARGSDVLSIHAVANEETNGLVSRQVLEALPRGAIVVNTARGELLDTDALLDLLEGGHLWAAALDTVDGEYDPDFCDGFAGSRLARYAREHDNLVLTPHIGGSTYDAWGETEHRVIVKAAAAMGLEAA